MEDWRLPETFPSSAGEIRWRRLGAQGAAPVVLLHGTPFSSYVWRTLVAALTRDHAVFVWDMPGYGESEKAAGQDVSLGMQGRVFSELIGHWGLDGFAVVAHDFGGAVALRGMLLHGLRYSRLALIDPVAIRPWGSPFFRLVHEHASVFERLPSQLHEALVRAYIAGASRQGAALPALDRLVEPWLGEIGQSAFYRQIAQADERYTDEMQSRYGSIAIPVVVCWGHADDWIPWQRGKELAAMIPGARFERIAAAGHLVQEDAPDALERLLVEFLATET